MVKKRKMFTVAHDAEIIEAPMVVPYQDMEGLSAKGRQKRAAKREDFERKFFEKRVKTDNKNSYATENILRHNFEKEWKANPGLRTEIIKKYSRY